MEKNNTIIDGEFLKLKDLGEGGFAHVYKVKNIKYGYVRAMRFLEAYVENENDDKYKQFEHECSVLLKLGNGNHPNIVRIYKPSCRAGRAFVEMDWIDGVDLRELINQYNGFVPVSETIRMLREIGSALAYCHHDIYEVCYDKESDCLEDADDGSALITPDKKKELIDKYRVTHNDIHTGNIMRRKDGTYILIDFGLARNGKDDILGSSRRGHGSVEFKSPARLDGCQPTPQDDIYSFGCVLYAMLTGKPPFPQQNDSQSEESRVTSAHHDKQPNPIVREDVPQWLKDMTMKCLAKDPADRYADGYELYQDILRHAEEKDGSKMATDDEEVMEMRKRIGVLEAEKSSLSHSLIETQKECVHVRDAGEHLEQMLSVQEKKVEKLQKDKSQLDQENEQLKKTKRRKSVVALVAGILLGGAVLVGGLSMAKRIVPTGYVVMPGSVNDSIDNLYAENNAKQMTIDSIEKENVLLKTSNTASGEQYASLVRENSRIKDEKESVENSNRLLQKENTSVKKQLEDQKKKSRDLETRLKTANSSQPELQKEIRELNAKVNKLEKEKNAALEQQKNTAQLNKRISDLERLNTDLSNQVATLKKENKALIDNM